MFTMIVQIYFQYIEILCMEICCEDFVNVLSLKTEKVSFH